MCNEPYKSEGNDKYCSWECREASRIRKIRERHPSSNSEYNWTYWEGARLITPKKLSPLNRNLTRKDK